MQIFTATIRANLSSITIFLEMSHFPHKLKLKELGAFVALRIFEIDRFFYMQEIDIPAANALNPGSVF